MEETKPENPPEKGPNPIRRLYDWVIALSEKPYAMWALFAISFAESSFFPIPPDVLLIPMVLAARTKAFRIATVCTVASVLGGLFGYYIGYALWHDAGGNPSDVANWFYDYVVPQAKFDRLSGWYTEYGFFAIFVAGLSPFPYKVITIFSGMNGIPLFIFITASITGRAARFFFVAWLLKKYGEPIKIFIDKHFNWLALAFCVLLGLGFYFLKMAH
jgi:membrane protein YqaA with SNARE-associated domain